EPLAKQAVGWGQAPWRSWSVLCVPPPDLPPQAGGGAMRLVCDPLRLRGTGYRLRSKRWGGGRLRGEADRCCACPLPASPANGGRSGWRVACAPPPPAGEGGTACEASGGVGAGSLTKMVGAAHAPPSRPPRKRREERMARGRGGAPAGERGGVGGGGGGEG